MPRPNPIEYAERLYAAIRAANFSPISFLAFGNAIKDGVELRRMPRIAAEPFMRIVGEMLAVETAEEPIFDAEMSEPPPSELQRTSTVRTSIQSADDHADPTAPSIATQETAAGSANSRANDQDR